jgi:hypothetical protein
MVNINPKLAYLKSRLKEFESNKEKLEKQIAAVLPENFLTKEALEKQLFLLFDSIRQTLRDIQTEESSDSDQLIQKKFNRLIDVLQSSESLWDNIQQAYRNTLSHWLTEVRQNVVRIQV